MKLKSTALLLLALAQPIIAAPTGAIPTRCPSFSTLQSVGIVMAEDAWPGWFIMSNKWYEDNNEWQFINMGLQGEDRQEVLDKLKVELQQLSMVDGPLQDKSDENSWACLYGSEEGHSVSMAMSPPMKVPQAMPGLLSKFKR